MLIFQLCQHQLHQTVLTKYKTFGNRTRSLNRNYLRWLWPWTKQCKINKNWSTQKYIIVMHQQENQVRDKALKIEKWAKLTGAWTNFWIKRMMKYWDCQINCLIWGQKVNSHGMMNLIWAVTVQIVQISEMFQRVPVDKLA